MAGQQEPMWPNLYATTTAPLSRMYSVPAYRASIDDHPKWTTSKVQAPCDECFALQHETKGGYGSRNQAKVRRAFRGGPALRLCRRHENAWRERDLSDMKARK